MPDANHAAGEGGGATRRWPRIPAGRLSLIYMLVAGGWVIGSDWLLAIVMPQNTGTTLLSVGKGIAFVAVTGGLLHGLLMRARRVQESIEASLIRNEDRYRRLAEHAPDIIYHYRLLPEPGFEYVSPAVTAILGYAPADFYADPGLVSRLVHPDDRPRLAGAASADVGGEPTLLRWLRRDGQLIWTEHRSAAVRDAAGRAVAIEGVARDVSERQRSAAQLRLLETALQAAASAVVIVDRTGKIEWANAAFTTLTGYAAAEAVGQTTRMLRSGQHGLGTYAALWETILSGQVWRGELINRRKDGSHYHEEQTITPVHGEGGGITHFIAIKQDVSDRVVRDREQWALASLTAALRRAADRADLAPAVLEQLPALVGAAGAALALREPTSGEALFEAGFGLWAGASGRRLGPGEGITGAVMQSGEPAVRPGPGWAPDAAGAPLPTPADAAACVPLRVQDEIIGALWVHYATPPGPADLGLLEAIAAMAGSAINRATLHEQTARRLRRLTSLHIVDQAIAGSLEIGPTLAIVLEQVTAQLGVDAAAVLLLAGPGPELRFGYGRGFRTGAAASAAARLGEGALGEAVLERRRICLPALPADGAPEDRAALLAAEGFAAYYAIPLVAKGHVKGALEVFHRAPLAPNAEWLHFLEALAAQAAIAIDNAELFEGLQRANDELALAYDSTLEGWARALELRDRETEGHSRRVTVLTERLARALGVPDEQLIHIRRGALLHDIGKMGVPDAILRKPGPLSPEEWELMREHPDYALKLLSPIPYLRQALAIPYGHHERWDGSGYPLGLAGEAIPLAARIFAVVDVWDALMTHRPYKPAWPAERSLAHLREHAGTLFDPQVVAAFLAIVEREGAAFLESYYEG